MDELVMWLGEQFDEDTVRARTATPGPWRYDEGKHHHIVGTPLFEEAVFAGPPGADANCVAGTGETDDQQSMRDAAFIAAHDPARVLREIDALRQVLAEYEQAARYAKTYWGQANASQSRAQALGKVVRLLALPYADRPGYREEWRP